MAPNRAGEKARKERSETGQRETDRANHTDGDKPGNADRATQSGRRANAKSGNAARAGFGPSMALASITAFRYGAPAQAVTA